MWNFRGQERPDFAIEPEDGQESVWVYPRAPTFYLPPFSVDQSQLVAVDGTSFCEWKGAARYFALESNPHTPVAWCYPDPKPAFREIRGYFGFYPGRVACFVDDERVQAQAGNFYGGWITADIAGPFKGDPGTQGW